MKIPNLQKMSYVWEKHHLEEISGLTWHCVFSDYLFKAVRRIEVRAVNQKTEAKSLDYYNYENSGMRVIAVGGNSLSKGHPYDNTVMECFFKYLKEEELDQRYFRPLCSSSRACYPVSPASDLPHSLNRSPPPILTENLFLI